MAGIEKTCEFSGEYPGWMMYGYKHNLIQVMPEYRKRFAGAGHVLHVFAPERHWISKSGSSRRYDPQVMRSYEPPFTSEREYQAYNRAVFKERLVNDYDYCLVVSDTALTGRVKGCYMNSTFDLATTRRKLKRMLKCRKLNIEYHDCSYTEWATNKRR